MNSPRTTDFLSGKRRIALDHELRGRTLTTHVRYSRDLRRYFRGHSFALRYSDEIHAGDSLLAIPGLALLLPLAWLTGSDVSLPCLDRRYAEAVDHLQQGYRALYPKMPFRTRLEIDDLIDSPPNPEGSALLFSGGMDACYSFFANRSLEPHLVQVFGTEFPCSEQHFLNRIKANSSAMAQSHGVGISFVETDFRSCVDERALYHAFSRVSDRPGCTLWNGVGYPVGFLSITAPLSAGRFNHLMLAGWASRDRANRMEENIDASSPNMDERLAWSNLRVEHHGCLHRHEKARAMKEWLRDNDLRVCWQFDDPAQVDGMMNCCRCEKCIRTIIALAVAGVDPAQCGFTIDPETIRAMREQFVSQQAKYVDPALWYQAMQREIPDEIEGDCFGLREFLEWFRDFDLSKGGDFKPSPFSIGNIYSRCPYPLALAIRSTVFGILGEPHWMNRVESLPPDDIAERSHE